MLHLRLLLGKQGLLVLLQLLQLLLLKLLKLLQLQCLKLLQLLLSEQVRRRLHRGLKRCLWLKRLDQQLLLLWNLRLDL